MRRKKAKEEMKITIVTRPLKRLLEMSFRQFTLHAILNCTNRAIQSVKLHLY